MNENSYAVRESMKAGVKYSNHYPTNYSPRFIYSNGKFIEDTERESRILSRSGRDDNPQEEKSKKKVRILNKRRRIRKNLDRFL